MEVEAKFRLGPEEAVRLRQILGNGKQAEQQDVYFAHPARDFRATDEALRLRSSGDRWTITYKGPRSAGRWKQREERNLAVADDPTALLEALGFRPSLRLAKRRTTYLLGDVEVALDAVEGLGDFLEVEYVGADAASADAAIDRACRHLGVRGEPVTRSYPELLAATQPRD